MVPVFPVRARFDEAVDGRKRREGLQRWFVVQGPQIFPGVKIIAGKGYRVAEGLPGLFLFIERYQDISLQIERAGVRGPD